MALTESYPMQPDAARLQNIEHQNMRIRAGNTVQTSENSSTAYQPEAPPSLSVSITQSPSVDQHHATTGTMSSTSQPMSRSSDRETFDSSLARELQPLSHHLDGSPSNSEADPSPALPQGHELVLVNPDAPLDVPALEAAPPTEKPRRRTYRRRQEWTRPEGMQMIILERKSGRSKGHKDTYYTLPGVSTNFRSIPEVQRYLEKKPVRIWRKNSGTKPSQPAEIGSSWNPIDPQPNVEARPKEPEGQTNESNQNELEGRTNDEERADRPKSRPKVCVQRNLFKRFWRHKRNNL